MATIRRFEDIQSWQKARTLTAELYRLSCTGEFSRDFALKDQMRRAGVSIISNIAEGFERDGVREFIQFLSNAKASAGELRAQLYVALDAGHLTQQDCERLQTECVEISRLIAKLMAYLADCEHRGTKFR